MTDEAATYSAWLAAYAPADTLERAHLAVHRACWEAGEIGSHLPGRHLTASAFVLDPTGGKVLVHWHAKARRWLQPGGHVEPGETPVAACLRELAEEAGLELDPPGAIFDLDVHRIGASAKLPEHDHVDVRFLFRATTEELPPSPEGSTFRWMPLADFAAPDSPDSGLARIGKKLNA